MLLIESLIDLAGNSCHVFSIRFLVSSAYLSCLNVKYSDCNLLCAFQCVVFFSFSVSYWLVA